MQWKHSVAAANAFARGGRSACAPLTAPAPSAWCPELVHGCQQVHARQTGAQDLTDIVHGFAARALPRRTGAWMDGSGGGSGGSKQRRQQPQAPVRRPELAKCCRKDAATRARC